MKEKSTSGKACLEFCQTHNVFCIKKKKKKRFETIDEFLPGPYILTRRNRRMAICVTIPGPSLLNNTGEQPGPSITFGTQTSPNFKCPSYRRSLPWVTAKASILITLLWEYANIVPLTVQSFVFLDKHKRQLNRDWNLSLTGIWSCPYFSASSLGIWIKQVMTWFSVAHTELPKPVTTVSSPPWTLLFFLSSPNP